jgi:hypothetical protein
MKQNKCQICKEYFDDSETYEYRGFMACEKHFDELCEKVDDKRKEVMETIEKSVENQRKGEFVNNRKAYHLGNVASDGLPIIKPKEPQILQDYEKGIL